MLPKFLLVGVICHALESMPIAIITSASVKEHLNTADTLF